MKNLLLILSICFFTTISSCQENTGSPFNLKQDVAVSGYDPVTYYGEQPKEGNKSINYYYNGAIYYFANKENKKTFIDNPKKYEPAYGGWCAYAMGLDKPEKVSINPKTYKIIDNRIYLFYNKFGVNTLNKWNEDEKNLKTKADKNWNVFLEN